MNAIKWVLIDSTNGATTQDGSRLSPAVLAHIAEAVQDQVNKEFAAEWARKRRYALARTRTTFSLANGLMLL